MMPTPYDTLPVFHFADLISKRHHGTEVSCLLFGNFGAYNMGDEAILRGQVEELKRIPDIKITVATRFPHSFRNEHARAVSLVNPGALIKVLWKSDFVIVGGGGLFCKNSSGITGLLFQFYFITLFLLVPVLLSKDIYVLGVGFYKNMNTFTAQYALSLLRFAQVVSVRDDASLHFLQEHNINATLYKDNSYLMKLPSYKGSFFAKTGARRNIGLALKKPTNKKDEHQLIQAVITFVLQNYKKANFWFYPLDVHPSYDNDYKFGLRLQQRLKRKLKKTVFHFQLIPMQWGPEQIFSSFRTMDFIVAMRLHSIIFAHRQRVPLLGISYDEKCSSFLQSIHEPVIRVSDVTAEIIQEGFHHI